MSKNPFILRLGAFLPQTAGYKREYPFEYPEIQLANDFLLNQFEGLITVTRTQQGLLIQGKFEAYYPLQCVRCLSNYDHLLSWELTELYIFNRRDATKEDLILPANAQVDLTEFIKEEAQLDIPINPICKEDCQGLCQICGANLNKGDCGHADLLLEKDVDEEKSSPFAGLKDLL